MKWKFAPACTLCTCLLLLIPTHSLSACLFSLHHSPAHVFYSLLCPSAMLVPFMPFAPFCVWFHPINPACALHTFYACLCTLHLLAPTCAFCVCFIPFAPSHAYLHPLHLCLCFCANLHLFMPKTAHYCNILKITVLLIFLVHWC